MELLNSKNDQVKWAHQSSLGKELLKGRKVLPRSEEFPVILPEQEVTGDMFMGKAFDQPGLSEDKTDTEDDDSETASVDMSKKAAFNPGDMGENDSDTSDEEGSRAKDGEGEGPFDDNDDLNPFDASAYKRMQSRYKELAQHYRELLDPREVTLRQLLLLNPDRHYKVEGLQDRAVLNRGLRLLLRERSGQQDEAFTLGPHISYADLRGDQAMMDTLNQIAHGQFLADDKAA